MIIVYEVDVKKTMADTHSVQWNARRSSPVSPDAVGDYNFKILFSQDPVSYFEPIPGAVIDGAVGPLFYAHNVKHLPHNSEYYYKVRAESKSDPSVYKDSATVTDASEYDGIIDTIRYAEEILNDWHIGEPVYLAKRKIDGGRCPECWNPYQFTRMKTHCNTCRGTGFNEGFYKAIPIQVAFEANPKVAISNQTGEVQVTSIRARMSNFPLVSPRDLIVKKDDDLRFTIAKVDITKLPNLSTGRRCKSGDGHVISQILDLSELVPDDPKYGVVVVGLDIKGPGSLTSKKSVTSSTTTMIPSTRVGSGSLVSKAPGVDNG